MMTKKEKADLEAAHRRAELLYALRWTGNVERDVPPPGSSDTFEAETHGWDINPHTRKASLAWSRFTSHGSGETRGASCGSQGALSLYSTEERALLAMRHLIELDAAATLAEIDKRIEAASGR